jgi:hypothetical protein
MIFPPLLERFLETDNPILKVKLRSSTQGVCRTLVDADLTAFAKLPVPFHLVLFFVERPAGIWTGNIAGKAPCALFMVNHRTNNAPV